MQALKMQCKDIPEEPILRFLAGDMGGWLSATWFDVEGGVPPLNSVVRAMPDGTPPKLALAKMRKLIGRGLVDGCSCGCVGSFQITATGRARIAAE